MVDLPTPPLNEPTVIFIIFCTTPSPALVNLFSYVKSIAKEVLEI